MANLTHPELAEIRNETLPAASLDALKDLRNRLCDNSASDYRLQSHQKFLRRVVSPDTPTRNLLMVHGTGVGKTCTAIQIAEEYILRPEFQEKKVIVVAGPAVQSNFKTEIFDINRVSLDKTETLLSSKQCTGRRYLDMLMRIEAEPKQWKVPDTRLRLGTLADRIINEFYDFMGYSTFGAMINKKFLDLKPADAEKWIHDTFDNRLLIVDEAHNLREGSSEMKTVSTGLETLVKTADGLVLVLLTATPMYDSHEEIVFYMNLFLWNDRKQAANKKILPAEFLLPDGSVKASKEQEFRDWVQTYVSYVKGENPFTFPFRLPPPEVAGLPEPLTGFTGLEIGAASKSKYLTVTASTVAGIQKKVIDTASGKDDEEERKALMIPTISVLPGNKEFAEVFRVAGAQWQYTVEPFLTPEKLPEVSAKFVTIIKQIEASKGVVMVYSNYVERGSRLFAMALEEHGFTPASGPALLANPAFKGKSKGEYMLLSSEVSTAQTNALLQLARSERNVNGEKVRIIVTTPRISEGVNFRYVRQVHLLDPWWNMSRIEQVIGRALRTCSHQALPFEEQNCSVYLHVLRSDTEHESFDEYTYRTKVEEKGVKIAKVRKIMEESAMDCPLQTSLNTLPEDWKNLEVPQRRSEGASEVKLMLKDMMASTFSEDAPAQCRTKPSEPEEGYVRPLSTYFDVRDEVFNKLGKLLIDKPIWDRDQLFAALKMYNRDVVVFLLQNAIRTGFKFKDAFGRPSVLQSHGDLYSLGSENGTIVERTTQAAVHGTADIEAAQPEAKPAETEVVDLAKLVQDLDLKDPSLKEDAIPEGLEAREKVKMRVVQKRTREQMQAVDQFAAKIKVDFAVVLPGYMFDRLTREQKITYLRSPAAAQLPFADRLRIPGTQVLVLGKDDYDPPDPVGDDRTAAQAWEAALIKRYTEDDASRMIATLKDGKFSIGKFEEKDGVFTRIHGAKRDVPIVCGTGSNGPKEVAKLALYTDIRKIGIPELPKKSTWTQCDIMELIAREQNNIKWYTPEEMDVLTKLKTKTKAKNNE
jgi:superfamily II DNA or RNA helicase